MTGGEYENCNSGLWIQVKRDADFRDSDTDCVKKSGGKKKDCYFLLLSDFANRIKGDDPQMKKVNACLESASVFRMQNSDKDMTKCMSYTSCNKDCDGGCDWPSGTTTSTTTTSTTTTRVANSAKTIQ